VEYGTAQESLTLNGKKGYVIHDVVFSPDGHQLASACHDGVIRIWDATPVDGQ
jgi:WD40 repeat protein